MALGVLGHGGIVVTKPSDELGHFQLHMLPYSGYAHRRRHVRGLFPDVPNQLYTVWSVINFTDFEAEYVKSSINTYLPKDIALIKAEAVDDRFHSRFNAKSKTYVYRIWNDIVPNVFENRFVYSYPKALDVAAMREAAGKLVGKHDFMAFCSNHRTKKSTVRTIYAADVEKIGNEIRIVFRGDGFLYNMARIMAGTILQSGSGEFDPSAIDGVFESRKRENAGITLPAKGLILEKVEYD